MERKQVPYINQDIELPLILLILRKNIIWIIALLIVLLAMAFIYLRYTIPRYEASTEIQLTEEQQELSFFEEQKLKTSNLPQELELLRSPVFLQRVLDSLPLEISYFNRGRFLDFDNYNQASYSVEILELAPTAYSIPINIDFESAETYNLKYKLGGNKFQYTFNTTDEQATEHFKINVTLRDTDECLNSQTSNYFVFNKPSDLLAQYAGELKIEVKNEMARTIKVVITDVNPFRACDIANKFAEQFQDFNLEKKKEGVNNVVDYIDKTLALVNINLDAADSSLQSFMKENNIVEDEKEDPRQDKSLTLLMQLENQKLDQDIQLSILKEVIAEVTKPNVSINEVLTQISQIRPDGYILSIVAKINLLISERDSKAIKLTDTHPEIVNINKQIDEQRALLINSLLSAKQSYESRIKELSTKIKELESGLVIESGTVPNQVEYMQRKRIFEVNQTYYDMLITKRIEYDLLSKGYTSGSRVLQFSRVPNSPVYPRKLRIILTLFGLWLVVTFITITVKYLIFDKVMDIDHIIKYCNASVLGQVAKYKNQIPVSQLVVDKNPKSRIAESFRNIRSNLDFISNTPGSKLIAVTSTVSGEGKTFVSINLAGILAFTDKKVIIIDADMRKPKIHVGFNVSNNKGLSNLLIGKIELEDCIMKSALENLHFITAGPIPPNPSELLLQNNMTELIATLQKSYDYVLVDNPPVGIVTDALTILQAADYPIYVFRAGVSRKHYINNLQKMIFDNKLTKISVILNDVDVRATSRYGYSYGYGSYGYNYGYTSYGYYDDEKGKSKKFSWLPRFRKKK